MHAYPLYRLNRPVIVMIMMAIAIIGVFAAPAALAPTINGAAPPASTVAASPARTADPAAISIAAQQHVTLAQAEIRLSWQQAVPSLDTALSSELPAAIFGGIWIALNNGDRVTIGAVSLDPRTRATVTTAVRAAGLSGAADLVQVRYGLGQLMAADDWLGTQLDTFSRLNAAAIHLSADYRTDLNRVQLIVAGHNLTTGERALVTAAKARYGGLIQVVPQPSGSSAGVSLACTYPYCSPPLRGGISITNTNSQGFGHQCTGAFIAASRTDGKLYQFTAGHCVSQGIWLWNGTWSTKFPDGSTHAIGPVHNYVFGNGGDEAILAINNPSGWQLPQGWVYVTAGTDTTVNQQYPISSAQYSTLNQRSCTTGASSGSTTCGVVTALGVMHTFCATLPTPSCATVNNLGQTNICSTEGDSGGPLYADHQAFGLLSGEWNAYTPCITLYQGIISAEKAMNVNIVLAR
jgi:streptogrisin C